MLCTGSSHLLRGLGSGFHLNGQRFLRNTAGKVVPPLTIKGTREKLKDIVGAQLLWGEKKPGEKTQMKIVSSQNELPPRNMAYSYREAVIPLGSDPRVSEKYLNFYKGIRFGRILEDLDTFAVAIGYSHSLDEGEGHSPMCIVTALVDRIELSQESFVPNKDIKMTGKVTWAGSSSMEITMDLDQELENTWKRILKAKFVMVARDPNKGRAAVINPLKPEGPEEKDLFKLGQASKSKRIEEGKKTLLKQAPNEDEKLLIHELFLNTIDPAAVTFRLRVKPDGTEWMENTILKNLVICMPEQRNLYNKIFGGFLMRKAFELAWANAALYCKTRPYIEVVDDIAFRKPVEVGSLLFLSSQVVYSLDTRIQVKVHAEVVDPKDGSHETTNDFHFTFNTRSVPPPRVLPKTYAESMLYLDGKRHFEH